MTLAVPIPFADFVLTLGDGATPTEVFTAPCAFNARALNFTKNLSEIILPDCDDEEKPGWIVRDPISITWDVSGEGLLDEGSIDTWDSWFMQTDSKRIRITISKADGLSSLAYTGQAHLQSWSRTANRGEFVMFNCAIAGTSLIVRNPVIPEAAGASFLDGAEEMAAYIEAREARKARRAAGERPAVKHSKAKAKETA